MFDYQPILRRWEVTNDPSRAIAKARRHRAPRGAGAQLRDTIVNAATELLIETGYAKAVTAYLLKWTQQSEFPKCVAGHGFWCVLIEHYRIRARADQLAQRVRVGVDALLQ